MSNIYGELPKSPVVYAACDSKYFMEHSQSFVYSANDVNKNVHIHVVNPTDEVLSLAVLLNATTEIETTFSFSDANLKDATAEQIRTWYACLRFIYLPNVLQTAKKVLCLDIDCYIMEDFIFPKERAGYFPREPLPGTSGWEAMGTRVAAGAVYVADMSIANAISKNMATVELRWFADQIVLSNVFRELGDKGIKKFDERFMDWEFVKGTKIWTGKGPRKYENKKYLEKKRDLTRLRFELMDTNTVILRPRLDIPFKKFSVTTKNSVNEPIRAHWQNFTDKIYYDARDNGDKVIVCTSPRWMFNNTIQKWFEKGVGMYVPHVERQNWNGNDDTMYYMQTVIPWLFTIDNDGWGGGMSQLKTFDPRSRYTPDTFDSLAEYINKGGSKFQHLQPPRGEVKLPAKYILIPLQLPHDETIKYHSDFSTPEFVEKLCRWGLTHRIPLVFKGHPVNQTAMIPLEDIINRYSNCHYTNKGNFHQLMENAEYVFVQNGGSGQEAMLLDKRVVVFAKAEYNAAVIEGDIDNLDLTWTRVVGDDWVKRKEMYRRWYDWYGRLTYSSIR
jgi:hypothetical protein